jgi:hypothetical protein
VVLLDGQRRSPARKLAIECGPGAGIAAPLDATIQLFAPATNPELIPAIRPTRRGLCFRQGEQMRLWLAALREAGQPMSVRQAAEYAMRAKGLPTDNAPIQASIAVQVRVALRRLEDKGLAVRIISAPDACWALAGE